MRVLITNNNSLYVGYLAGRYPDFVGHLYSPGGFRGPYKFMPFGLDNGRYASTTKGFAWDEEAFLGMLDRVSESAITPEWLLVPDVVGDRDETLREWDKWQPRLCKYGWPLAFAVQDGMEPEDVPDEAYVVFVGGTTDWKRQTIHLWCESSARVHVGRINTERWLWYCYEHGVESCDGTGWLRGDLRQLAGLENFLDRASRGLGPGQGQLWTA